MELIGGIDEAGFLQTFEYKGIDTLAGFDELIANSYDAKSTRVFISKEVYNGINCISINDNGHGLTKETSNFMFHMYKQKNRANEIGMANAGSKYSMYNLSKKSVSYVISKNNDDYITLIADWNKMIREGKYTNNIISNNSTEEDIEIFNSVMSDRKTGTSILVPYSDDVWDVIKNQFLCFFL